jgi:peptidyl-prolyl cis-trans isomerase SurA
VQRKLTTLISLAVIVSIAALMAACGSGAETPDNTVAATVNGKKIMMSEVERVIHQQAQGKESQMSEHDLAGARLQVLDNLILREVLFQRSEQEKLIPSDEEITNAINKQKQQSALTDEDFARQLKEQNLSMEALRDETKKDIAVQKLQEKYASKVTITNREVEDFYNTNRAQFVSSRGIGLAMIVADPGDNGGQVAGPLGDAKNEADAKVKIDSIYQQLKNGADFADVARTKSEDRSGLQQGGDIGFASEDDLKQNGFAPDLVSQLFKMDIGSFTTPVRFTSPQYPGGRWYIFKLKEKQLETQNLTLEGNYPNGESVRQRITATLQDQRKEIVNQALQRVAMSEAKIVNSVASQMLANPSNLGLRPASSEPAKPGSSPAAATASPAASSSPAAAKSGSLPAASPTAKK